ncbi:MAG: Maleylpyruvate isomerase [Paracidovorax wautersii]|uniref:Maleylpyruvate isomerase n=1 Tax=Paracidovorax wautersii TaxID=1177982 RepID=A0A7V8FRF7_9BURK|nr:MAG: Maleylpyruvate isomerase [Paracidovorax wautersii]
MTASRTLYTYFRSSAAYRVRIALNIKGLGYDAVPVHLLKDGGQQRLPAYRALNPFGLVPTYVEDKRRLHQSLAVIEYLDERHPTPPLLPGDAWQHARIREVALAIACEIHPINNLRILHYLTQTLGVADEARQQWIRHWMQTGLEALEATLAADGDSGDRFCIGDQPTLADCCLVPQLFNARRFGVDLTNCPRLVAADAACAELPAFQQAHPQQQPDAE